MYIEVRAMLGFSGIIDEVMKEHDAMEKKLVFCIVNLEQVKTCISCKNLKQLEFYSLIWFYKIYFPSDWVSCIKKKDIIEEEIETLFQSCVNCHRC